VALRFLENLAACSWSFWTLLAMSGRAPWSEEGVPARRKAFTYTGQHNIEWRGQTPMPWVGFEPTLPISKRSRSTPYSAQAHCDRQSIPWWWWWWWWWSRWTENTTSICGHQRAYCSSTRWYMSMENYGEMILTGEFSWFVHQSSLAILEAASSESKSGGTWRRKL
jgi:hypothetical protein